MERSFSAGFLESLLTGIDLTRPPLLFDTHDEFSLAKFPKKILERIAGFVPLRDRVRNLSLVSTTFHSAVRESVRTISFYKDGLDVLSDVQLKYFLSVYGSTVNHLNFDLFRSSRYEECSQWNWRQTVLDTIALCPNIKQITAVVCGRHRIRDYDIMKLRAFCPQLRSLVVDGYFIKGHCFKVTSKAWRQLERLEIDFCYRLSAKNLLFATSLFKNLKILHLSQAVYLSDEVVESITNMRQLEELSLISSPELKFEEPLTPLGLSKLCTLRNLRLLALDGISVVDDEFLVNFCHTSAPVASSLKSLSLAFCRNFTAQGILHLIHLRYLENLNLDGISQNFAPGLMLVAQKLSFVRLYFSEKACIDPSTLLKIVIDNPTLQLLDISDNYTAVDQYTAYQIASAACQPNRSRLVIVTDYPNPWFEIPKYSNMQLRVVYMHRKIMFNEVPPLSLIDNDSVSQLPETLLQPGIRKGNRYRLLYAALGSPYPKDKEVVENKENRHSPNESPHNRNGSSPNSPSILSAEEEAMASISVPPGIYDFVAEYASMQILNSIQNATQSGGAPRPPMTVPEMPRAIVRYTRSSHMKRRSHPPVNLQRQEPVPLNQLYSSPKSLMEQINEYATTPRRIPFLIPPPTHSEVKPRALMQSPSASSPKSTAKSPRSPPQIFDNTEFPPLS